MDPIVGRGNRQVDAGKRLQHLFEGPREAANLLSTDGTRSVNHRDHAAEPSADGAGKDDVGKRRHVAAVAAGERIVIAARGDLRDEA
ncbi:MAG: hypothetical protein F9K16_01805 [Thermoanaerobaculia bacterium]|nr:MAG: hypothetical protein F9K16_01805 [Thermoanaerobaculia bacterium]